MPRIIARKNPVVFKTQALRVQASPETLRYTPVGSPLSFAQMQALRVPITIDNPQQFDVTVANLGVSVDLTLEWQGRSFRLLVRQERPGHGDEVLKLISGYVPAHELRVPLLTAMTEIAEELLLEGPHGWLQGRYQQTWLPTPYASDLPVDTNLAFDLTPDRGHTRPVCCGNQPLLERPRAYIHLPSNSLQLVYSMRLTLPEGCDKLTALHADEVLDSQSGELRAHLDYELPDLYLCELRNDRLPGQIYMLKKGVLVAEKPGQLQLSEAMAEQVGWVIEAERSAWPEGLARL
ncbi:metal ABC transporter ATPase [Pseudomonas sp. OIL-1]|uniref:metal ABC transporter ATPase n=1 Tax=Pseudomonas sp. OIL-1 TaxID=2706126 RepID=UPI0013A7412C|nr:metal ABC transporter ATPase [Pseudomonas sp. OIL-1]QIB52982.1 metal ABC transporter ATPase [Pseudomonas sp. OIL-1]